MKVLLICTIVLLIISIIIIVSLLFRIHFLYKKLKFVNKANMWHRLAISDDLTGLHNRNAYNMRIVKIKKEDTKRPYGIVLFDVDDFKMVNDTKGHLAGDEVLKKVATILLEVFPRPGFEVFRIGGDEFAVISRNFSENDIIKRLIVLKQNLKSNGNISLSNGYSIFRDDFDESFRCADEMLYADKLLKKINVSQSK